MKFLNKQAVYKKVWR